jgi:ABC-2 type transport system ATP-binding protein
MQQLADDVVIIHHGRLVTHEPVEALTARAAGGTRVRSPQAVRLRELLDAAGIAVSDGGAADRIVVAAGPEQVGELAAANGVVLHELTAETSSLEEAFLQLTSSGGIE